MKKKNTKQYMHHNNLLSHSRSTHTNKSIFYLYFYCYYYYYYNLQVLVLLNQCTCKNKLHVVSHGSGKFEITTPAGRRMIIYIRVSKRPSILILLRK